MTDPADLPVAAERADIGTHGRELILDARNIGVTFAVEGGTVQAVRDVSFQLHKGETIALVGESGSGKSVTARTIMRLLTKRATIHPATRITLGQTEITSLSEGRMRKMRGRDLAMIFQEPMSSLNPVYTIGKQIVEILRLHSSISHKDAMARAEKLLEEVQIPEPAARLRQYPHQLSGGQRQRVMIAMALANRPKLLIADEPGTALDVTVQAQTLDLMRKLVADHGTAVLFISHNLGVVREFADRTYVIYRGRIVEKGPTAAVFADPRHAYTRALLAAQPRLTGGPLPEIAERDPAFENPMEVHP
jgi:peptide/nickel transport system ATP-binding protein